MAGVDHLSILVVEDDEAKFNELRTEMQLLAREGVVRYEGTPLEENRDPDDALSERLRSLSPLLVVLDMDLTQYRGAVTRGGVRLACEDTATPLAVYTKQQAHATRLRTLEDWKKSGVPLGVMSTPELAARIVALADGFRLLAGTAAEESRGSAEGGLFARLCRALKAPEPAILELEYAWAGGLGVAVQESTLRSRAAETACGYWIVNQLMQFPGILLSSKGAAAYLDLGPNALDDDKVAAPFLAARYDGAFSTVARFWWRAALDEILAMESPASSATVYSGRELLAARGVEVSRSECYQGHPGAGYQCWLTGRPVCAEHSHGLLDSAPRCGTLTRIAEDKYDELLPWLGGGE